MYNGDRRVAAAALDDTRVPLMARGINPVTGTASFYWLGWNIVFGPPWLELGPCGSIRRRRTQSGHPVSEVRSGHYHPLECVPDWRAGRTLRQLRGPVFDGKVEQDWAKTWDGIYEGLVGPGVAIVSG